MRRVSQLTMRIKIENALFRLVAASEKVIKHYNFETKKVRHTLIEELIRSVNKANKLRRTK